MVNNCGEEELLWADVSVLADRLLEWQAAQSNAEEEEEAEDEDEETEDGRKRKRKKEEDEEESTLTNMIWDAVRSARKHGKK